MFAPEKPFVVGERVVWVDSENVAYLATVAGEIFAPPENPLELRVRVKYVSYTGATTFAGPTINRVGRLSRELEALVGGEKPAGGV